MVCTDFVYQINVSNCGNLEVKPFSSRKEGNKVSF